MIRYPPGYQSTLGRRTDDEVMRELDRRAGFIKGECRSIPLSEASPAPEEQFVRASKFIKAQPKKNPVPGLASACGRNSKAKR